MRKVYRNILTGDFITEEVFIKLPTWKKSDYELIIIKSNDSYVSK